MGRVCPISKEIRNDLKKVEKGLAEAITQEQGLLVETSVTTLEAGGKRLRPALVLVSAIAGNYDLEKLMPAAIAIELIHMASLVHDDVLDKAPTRRGLPTVNSTWGREVAVATGDFLFAKAFDSLAKVPFTVVMEKVAAASLALSVGELKQIKTAYSVSQSVDDYFEKVNNKTAALFAASCFAGAVISEAAEEDAKALESYGMNLGMAFQVYDDVLDFQGEESVLGKEVGKDLKEGDLTLPVFLALEDPKVGPKLKSIINGLKNNKTQANKAVELIKQSSAVDRAKEGAKGFVEQAKKDVAQISNQKAKEALGVIGDFVINRYH